MTTIVTTYKFTVIIIARKRIVRHPLPLQTIYVIDKWEYLLDHLKKNGCNYVRTDK